MEKLDYYEVFVGNEWVAEIDGPDALEQVLVCARGYKDYEDVRVYACVRKPVDISKITDPRQMGLF